MFAMVKGDKRRISAASFGVSSVSCASTHSSLWCAAHCQYMTIPLAQAPVIREWGSRRAGGRADRGGRAGGRGDRGGSGAG